MKTVEFSEMSALEKEFRKVQYNPIYFYELYWKEKHPEEPELTRDQKQALYNKYRGIPVIDMDQFGAYEKRRRELKDQGYEDWEIMM